MKTVRNVFLLAVAGVTAAVIVKSPPLLRADDGQPAGSKPIIEVSVEAPDQPKEEVKRTDEEWREKLTAAQYHILRKAGTERPNGQAYREFKKHGEGTYYCAGCDAELFTSKEKFDSHCGWPSFYDPSKAKNVKFKIDFDIGYARTEVLCKVCDGHLGHVFEGEGFDTPTDKRFCINGTVLKFVPRGAPTRGEAKDEAAGEDGAARPGSKADRGGQ